MSSIEPDGGGGEVDGGEEVACGFVIARGDSTVLLEFAEEVFDKRPRFIKAAVIGARLNTVLF